MGQVPALVIDDGEILTEGPAILQYVADRAPASGLAPATGTRARTRLHQWLNYVGSEIHKPVFATIFNPMAPPAAKEYARGLVDRRFDLLSRHLADRPYLVGEGFTVAEPSRPEAARTGLPLSARAGGADVPLAAHFVMRALPLAPTTVPKSPDRGLRRSAATARGRNREQLETELDEARE